MMIHADARAADPASALITDGTPEPEFLPGELLRAPAASPLPPPAHSSPRPPLFSDAATMVRGRPLALNSRLYVPRLRGL